MAIARAKGSKGKCDALFSKIIRQVGHCQRCFSTDWLQCAHIHSRRFNSTRCDLDNAVCLCASCHRYFTDHPVDFTRWLDSFKPEGWDVELNKRAQAVTKVDWDEVLENLKAIAAERGVK